MARSWRKHLLDSGYPLTEEEIKVLKYGPQGPWQTNKLQKLKSIYKEKIINTRKV